MSLLKALKGLFSHVATTAQTGAEADIAALEQHVDALKAGIESEIADAIAATTKPLTDRIAALEAKLVADPAKIPAPPSA